MDHRNDGHNSDNGIHLVMAALDTIRKTQLDQAEANGRIEANIAALAGPEGRITKVEKKLEKNSDRQWWLHAISPALLAVYAIARRLGFAI